MDSLDALHHLSILEVLDDARGLGGHGRRRCRCSFLLIHHLLHRLLWLALEVVPEQGQLIVGLLKGLHDVLVLDHQGAHLAGSLLTCTSPIRKK